MALSYNVFFTIKEIRMKKILLLSLVLLTGISHADEQPQLSAADQALLTAAESSDLQGVQDALENGAIVDAVDIAGITPLMMASAYGNIDIVALLVSKGANVNANVNAVDNYGVTALMFASNHGHKDIVELLITKGANVNAVSEEGTALMFASNGGDKDIVELLISKGANVNAVTIGGFTALMRASMNGQKDIGELLISKGANVNAVAKDGTTALMRASMNGNKDVIELLLNNGANPSLKNNDRQTALDIAKQWAKLHPQNYNPIIELLENAMKAQQAAAAK